MAKELKIHLKIDANTGKIKQVSDGFVKLDGKVKKATTSLTTANTKLLQFAKAAASVYVVTRAFHELEAAYMAVAETGFGFNSQMENSRAGLTSLAMTMLDQTIPATERQAIATREAAAALDQLLIINRDTPHTLGQTVEIYKAMYVGMRNAGASSRDIIGLTKQLSIAAGAAGIPFQSLLASVDGLGSGTVKANSELGRFLNSLGLSNTALKNSSDLVGLLNDKLKDFHAFDTLSVALSNFQNEWNILAGKMTQDVFSGSKTSLKELSGALHDLSDSDIETLRAAFNGLTSSAAGAGQILVRAFAGAGIIIDGLGTGVAALAFRLENLFDWTETNQKAMENLWVEFEKEKMGMLQMVDTADQLAHSLVASSSATQDHTDKTRADASALDNRTVSQERATAALQKEADANVAWQKMLSDMEDKQARLEAARAKTTATTLDYYQTEIDTANAIMDGTAAITDANNALAGNSSAWLDAASDVYDYADALEAAATTHSMLYDSHGNLQNSMMDKVNAQTHGVGTTVSLTDDQVMRMNTFSPYTGYRGDVAKNQEEIRKKRSDADYQSLMEENRKKIDQENHTRQSRAREAERALEKIRREGEQARQKAEREAAKRIEARRKAEAKRYADILRDQGQRVKEATDALRGFQTTLQSIHDGLGTDFASKARQTLYGGTDQAKSLDEYFADSRAAWEAFAADTTNEDLLSAYNRRMDEAVGALTDLNDTSKFESKAQQDWAKASAMHTVSGFQSAQLQTQAAVDQQLATLKDILGVNTEHKGIASGTKSLTELIKSYTSATQSYANTIKSHTASTKSNTASTKSNTATTASKHQTKEKGYHDEWVKTGNEVITEQIHTYNLDGTVAETKDKQYVVDTWGKKRLYQEIAQFQSGGYTGDYGINEAVGIVHGQEYVVNAASTKDLGLNGSQGLFQQMVSRLEALERHMSIMQTVLLEIAGTNGQIAYSERLRNYADGIEEVA